VENFMNAVPGLKMIVGMSQPVGSQDCSPSDDATNEVLRYGMPSIAVEVVADLR
jgi:hypothetical protein